ncbi:hypothetical protein [Candidatus Marimicrobium litorale]|uniref:Uncharacterized protein n=1 Tax=Candidatus Marimicrobium litorale TaxID=2518991 RepID=A0ABT3T4E1_9GAMM|nr:hypothetical protein [Candidatus Marimicrobium litorale]MCX2976364.1 hypothetical protein [Candidatus Marimicrobium litorale]
MAVEVTANGRKSLFDQPTRRPRKRPGPKPGGYNPGAFTGADDPRRWKQGPCMERAALRRSIEEMAKDHAEEALQAIAALIDDPNATPKVRLEAASEILDRSFGSVVNRAVIGTISEQGANIEESNREAIGRQVNALLSKLEVVSEQ